MRKIIFCLLTVCVWYLAGLYRSSVLMALALVQIFLLLGMYLLSHYLNRHFSAGFAGEFFALTKGEPANGVLWIENNGKLPSGRSRLCISVRSPDGRRKKQSIFLEGLESQERRNLPLSLDTSPQCGIYTIEWKAMWVWDYLSLFRRKKKLTGHIELAVFPPEESLNLSLFQKDVAGQLFSQLYEAFLPGNSRDNIRQLRDYVPGEPIRLVHWKQSARLDRLLIREYTEEQNGESFLFLHMGFGARLSAAQREAFYEILYALLLSLLKQKQRISASWKTENGALASATLNEPRDSETFLLSLYRLDAGLISVPEDELSGLRFGTDLRLLYNGKLLFQFSADRYKEEMACVDLRDRR